MSRPDPNGPPGTLQLARPAAGQRIVFGTLAPIARLRGYRATYPQFSRTVLAPRD